MFNQQKGQLDATLPGFETIKRYWDHNNKSVTAKILPGEYYVTGKNELVTTVLGSCVAACIRDSVFGIGGMNHFMLPEQGGVDAEADLISVSARYGTHAMELLINSILSHGGMRKNLEVKVFGGGRVLKGMTDIGERNIAFVRDYLHTEGFTVLAEDLGDVYPRKVIYNPKNGKARIKKIRNIHANTIISREKSYKHDIETEKKSGGVELF